MGFKRVPCPGLYLRHKATNPKLFVAYCQAFIETNDRGHKAIGIETDPGGTVYILTMPDYSAKKPIVTFSTVKGKKTKNVTWEQMWKVPIEVWLSEEDFEYLKKKGMDKHGNHIEKKSERK
jgi:hypothetical protein